MKVRQLFLIFLIIILAIPFVNATITSNPLSSSVYNFGDKILISGDVTYNKDVRTSLDLFLNCNSNSIQVATTSLNLKSNESSSFSNLVTLPSSLSGKCDLVGNLNDLDGKLLETYNLGSFEVSGELKSNFQINKNEFQLGDTLSIKGSVLKQSGIAADGVFVVSFKQGTKLMFMDTIEVSGGLVNYTKFLNRIAAGKYSVDVLVKDNLGNTQSFTGLFEFDIVSALNVNIVLDKGIYSPGDSVVLNGFVSSNLLNSLKNINLDFDFEGAPRGIKLKTSTDTFTTNYVIPVNIKSGEHNITIIASDENGNYVVKNIQFNVQAIPTTLETKIDSTNYDPSGNVLFVVSLFDQAGEAMSENIKVDILDSKGKNFNSMIVETGKNSSFTLVADAVPGYWKLDVNAFGLNSNAMFNVRESKKLDAKVDGQNLVVENTGNIPYNGLLDVIGNDLVKSQNVKLNVGAKQSIKLDSLFSPGNYSVSALGKYLGNVVIPEAKSLFGGFFKGMTGNATKNVSGSRQVLLFFALVAVCCGLFYLLFLFKKGKKDKIQFSEKDFKLGQKKLDELRAKGIRKDPPRREFGVASKEDIEDWKKRIHASIKEQEKMSSQNEFVNHQQKSANADKPSGGMFNMFN